MSAVADLISELDDHGFADTLASRKVSVINDVANDVNSRQAWRYLQATTTITLDSVTPTMPADFRAVISLVIPSTGTILRPEDIRGVRKSYPSSANSTVPFLYYFVGSALSVYPTPDGAYPATLDYYRNQAVLTENSLEGEILLPPRHHRVLVLGALSKLYSMEDDAELAVLFDNQFEARIARMAEDLDMAQFDRPMQVVDVYGDSFDGSW